MKTIGNIHLIWRPKKGDKRISVGIMKKSATEGIRFQYNKDGVSEAKEKGFLYYEGFPDLNKDYKENVIGIFGQRLTRSERPDTKEFYDFWHIDTSKKENKYYMLAFTQGLLPTDNFEFLADFNPKEGLTFVTEIAGLSKTLINSNLLQVGDNLRYELDRENEFVVLFAAARIRGRTRRRDPPRHPEPGRRCARPDRRSVSPGADEYPIRLPASAARPARRHSQAV